MCILCERLFRIGQQSGRAAGVPAALVLLSVLTALWLSPSVAAQSVSLVGGSWTPNPAFVGDVMTVTGSGSDSAIPTPQNEDTVTPHWTWNAGTIYYSNDGTPGSFTPYTGGGFTMEEPLNDDDTQSGFTLTGAFAYAGYYIVTVTVSVTYHDDTTDKDVVTNTGSGYVGGTAGDISTGAGPNAAPAISGSGVRPDAIVGGNVGIYVRQKGQMVIALSNSAGPFGKNPTIGLGKSITATGTAQDQNLVTIMNDYVTVSESMNNTSTNGFGQVSFPVTPDQPGKITFTANSSDLPPGHQSATASATVVKPTGEVLAVDAVNHPATASVPAGWSDTYFFVHSVLTDTSVDFSGDHVGEYDPARNPDHDGCFIPDDTTPDAPSQSFEELGGPLHIWSVLSGNSLDDDDGMGWFPARVTYYRLKGKAPCYAVFKQIMAVHIPAAESSVIPYTTHTLTYTIGATTLTISKDNISSTRPYP